MVTMGKDLFKNPTRLFPRAVDPEHDAQWWLTGGSHEGQRGSHAAVATTASGF